MPSRKVGTPSGTYNLEVDPGFLENPCTSERWGVIYIQHGPRKSSPPSVLHVSLLLYLRYATDPGYFFVAHPVYTGVLGGMCNISGECSLC